MTSLPEPVEAPFVEDWCQTKLEIKSFKFKWTIKHFSWCSEQCGDFIESSKFPASANSSEPYWSLRAYPRGYDETYPNYLRIAIVSNGTAKVYASVQITVLSDKKECAKSEKTTFHFTRENTIHVSGIYISRNELINKANGYLPLDTLTVLCEVSVVDEVINLSGQSNVVKVESSKNKLWHDLEDLYTSKKSSDVTLVAAGGHELKAHKAVLVARSMVFDAMFEHEMKEQKLCYISIEDIEANVLNEMLHFMYTAATPNLDSMAEDLLIAADKYALEDLKIRCEKSLLRSISVEKAANILVMADRYNSQQLKLRAIDFILKNATAVMDTAGWKDMVAYPHLTLESLSLMAQKLRIN